MQKHLELTRNRLQQFASETGIASRLYPDRTSVKLLVFSTPDRIAFVEAIRGTYRHAQVGEKFGPLWSTHWFRVECLIPENWNGKEVHLLWDSSSEACVWQKGEPLQGLTGSSIGWSGTAVRKEFILTKKAHGGERIELYVEMACNGLFGSDGLQPDVSQLGLLRQAEIAIFDRQAWELLWDFKVISDMARLLPANSPRGGQALYTANSMVNVTNLDEPSSWARAREIAAQFFSAHNGDGQHNLSAIGHAHIDTAWLWPLAETRRKCIRTFSSALRYMEDYPHYKFACSQAQQYAWIKEMTPGLYEKIKTKVKEGRFIPAGGSWVEPDCNIPSGESLVRQFLIGQRFFKQEFGSYCNEFWEPDVFGYSAALPQILLGVGIRYFLTIKLSWSQFNKIQSNTFWWQGLDGSRVLTHFPPADDYNAMADVEAVLRSVNNFKDHDRSRESYMLFGFGDGGGGPTMPMLEQINRMRNVDGLPRVEIRSPHDFFTRCEADAKDLTTWVGELYLELHRGTYTTQAHNKFLNRQSELLLRDLEFLSTICNTLGVSEYPAEEIDWLWKIVLTNQFHDIIPGSSINEVYQDSAVHYREVHRIGSNLLEKAIETLLKKSDGSNVLAINTLSESRTEIVNLPAGIPAIQISSEGHPLGVVTAPPMGYSVSEPIRSFPEKAIVSENSNTISLENENVRAVFDRGGGLISLFDKHESRECIESGKEGNHFVLFDDTPVNWDAWDVDVFHLEKRYEVNPAKSARVIESGPIRASIEFIYQISKVSELKQIVSLTALSSRLDFMNEVEWYESRKFLKVEFPLDIQTQNATYEIQFGHLQRPTHSNTSWDMARFEVCGHKWADLSEPDYGVTLLNDCKYGHGTQGNVLRLSLLRSPKSPDPQADMGHHTFRYALLPHKGTLQQADIVMEGYRFNVPLLVRSSSMHPQETSFFQVDTTAVVIDTVKKAEDSNAIILRLYESHGTHVLARLKSSLPVKSAAICNLLEEEDQPIEWNEGINLKLRPFQILTVKLDM